MNRRTLLFGASLIAAGCGAPAPAEMDAGVADLADSDGALGVSDVGVAIDHTVASPDQTVVGPIDLAGCGAVGTACCASSTCDSGAVCDGMACVAVVAPAQCPNGAPAALFVTEVAPPPTLLPWQQFRAVVTFANCSGSTWNATSPNAPSGYKVGTQAPQDDDVWVGTSRIGLPADVPTGMQVTVAIPLRAPPLTGPRAYQLGIVHEGVAWLQSFSPLHMVDVEATSNPTTICAAVTADVGGVASASAALQACVDAAAAGSTLDLPPGIYRMTGDLHIDKPLVLRTVGTQTNPAGCLDHDGPPCVVLRADDNLDVPRGFLRPGATTAVVLDHLLLDGNRDRRGQSAAAGQCAAGNNGAGFNASTPGCVGCGFVRSGSARALCGTGFEWSGDMATFDGSTFRDNGDHTMNNMWSDGLTLLRSSGATVKGCTFIDNSDVDLILGGTAGGMVLNNFIRQRRQAAFAGLMLDNFNGSTPGDFTGTVVSGNTIDCGALLCDFGIELGPHAWYLSSNTVGGTVTGNSVGGGKFNINVEGAGTMAAPITVTGNTVGSAPSSATFLCGVRPTTAFNVSPDSFVNLGGGPQPTGALTFHSCP